MTASLGQVALVRLPIVQKTTAAKASAEARNWTSASSALKVKTSYAEQHDGLRAHAALDAQHVNEEGRKHRHHEGVDRHNIFDRSGDEPHAESQCKCCAKTRGGGYAEGERARLVPVHKRLFFSCLQ